MKLLSLNLVTPVRVPQDRVHACHKKAVLLAMMFALVSAFCVTLTSPKIAEAWKACTDDNKLVTQDQISKANYGDACYCVAGKEPTGCQQPPLCENNTSNNSGVANVPCKCAGASKSPDNCYTIGLITTDKAATAFTNSGLFTIIQNFARLLGFFIVAFAIFRVVQRVTSQGGEGGLMQSMRMLLPAVVVAAILMQLTIITTIVGFAVGVVAGIIDLFGDAVGA